MRTIAIDFDGVIHAYSQGWKNGTIYDEPVPDAFNTIRNLMGHGFAVYVHTTRKPGPVLKWLGKYLWSYEPMMDPKETDNYDRMFWYGFGAEKVPWHKQFWDKPWTLGVTNRKLPAEIYIDDRAVRFEDWTQTNRELSRILNHA